MEESMNGMVSRFQFFFKKLKPRMVNGE